MVTTIEPAASHDDEKADEALPPPTIPYRPDIDGLRAIAVALVVLYHAGTPGFSGGYVGVDVFFAISGFLITSVLVAQGESGRFSLLGFYAGRVRRLLPLATVVLVTTVAFGVWLLPATRATDLVSDARSALFYVSNWRFAEQSVAYVDVEVSEGMLTHFWSLSVEEQFYLGWPLILAGAVALVRVAPKLRLRTVVAVLAGVVTVASLWMSIQMTPTEGSRAYYLSHLRLWEISAGAFIAVLPSLRRLPLRAITSLQVAAVAAIVATSVWYDDATAFPGHAALLPVVATIVIIAVGGRGSRVDRVLTFTPMRYVGERSYSWYLWHWPALGISELLARRYEWGASHRLLVTGAIAVSFALAILTHRLIENPIRYSLRLKRFSRWSIAVGAASTLLLAAVASPTQSRILEATAKAWASAPVNPADAEADSASHQFRPCHNGMGQRPQDREVIWCEAGDPNGAATVALVGDSHAQHWAPAFDEAGKINGWRVLITTRSSCLPYDVPMFNGRLEVIDTGCRNWGRSVEDAIAADGSVDLVVVGRARGYAQTIRNPDGSQPADRQIEAALTDAASRFMTSILGHAQGVMIIADTPWAPYRVPDCLLSGSPGDAPDCDFKARTTPLEVPLLAAESAAAEAIASGEASVASLSTMVCPGEVCNAVTPDGLITYRDQHHMTATYSRTLGPELGRVLSQLLTPAP